MIITDDLNEYVALKGLINHCTHTLETTRNCSNCEMNKVCNVALGISTLNNFKVKYEPYYVVSKAAPRELEAKTLKAAPRDLETKTLDEWKKDGDKVELTF